MGFKLVVDVESAATSTAAPEPVPVPEVEEDDIDGLFNDCCFNGVSFGKWTVLLDIFGLICRRILLLFLKIVGLLLGDTNDIMLGVE